MEVRVKLLLEAICIFKTISLPGTVQTEGRKGDGEDEIWITQGDK
jgi:hypothetical protein